MPGWLARPTPTGPRSATTVRGRWNATGSAGCRSPPSCAPRRAPRCPSSPRRPRSRRAYASPPWSRSLGAALGPWWARRRRHRFASPEASRADVSRRLRHAAEHLGPTYIKLGQIISSGEGLFPKELVSEFKLCRDQVPAEPFDTVRTVVESDLGGRIEDLFASFDTTPLAAASIAQVHAATLRTGEEVVVKVQRAAVDRLVHKDLRVMSWLAPFLVGRIPIASLANPPALVELFAETIVEELDFRMEAANMIDIATMLHELGQTGYVVPRPHPAMVTRRVLVMERLRGFNFDDVAGMKRRGHRHRGRGAHGDDLADGRARWSRASSTATCTAATCSCCRTAAPHCWTSASSAGSARSAAWPSCG